MAYALEAAFEWDPAKDEANRRKHGLGFEEAAELFASDEDYLVVLDQSHRGSEGAIHRHRSGCAGCHRRRLDGAGGRKGSYDQRS
jgi:hypothetical protein